MILVRYRVWYNRPYRFLHNIRSLQKWVPTAQLLEHSWRNYTSVQGLRMGAGIRRTCAPDRKIYISIFSIDQLLIRQYNEGIAKC